MLNTGSGKDYMRLSKGVSKSTWTPARKGRKSINKLNSNGRLNSLKDNKNYKNNQSFNRDCSRSNFARNRLNKINSDKTRLDKINSGRSN